MTLIFHKRQNAYSESARKVAEMLTLWASLHFLFDVSTNVKYFKRKS